MGSGAAAGTVGAVAFKAEPQFGQKLIASVTLAPHFGQVAILLTHFNFSPYLNLTVFKTYTCTQKLDRELNRKRN